MADTTSKENSTNLSSEEEEEVTERSPPRAAVVYETVRKEGESELIRPVEALIFSGLAAGLSMGFSLVALGLIEAHLPDAIWRPLVAKFGYSAGFLIVVLGRQQLFTENTLTVILPLLQRLNYTTLMQVLKVWGLVLISNLAGTLAFAWVIAHTNIFEPEIKQVFNEIGYKVATSGDWFTIFMRSIFAGWLIALMVWLLPAAESGRIWIIIIMTYLVALGEYSHIIAGSTEVFYAIATGSVSWSYYFISWMLPTLLGNIVGGVTLVAVLGHAQVVNEATYS